RHSQHLRSGVPVDSHRGDGTAARSHHRRYSDRRAVSAERRIPRVHALRPALPAVVRADRGGRRRSTADHTVLHIMIDRDATPRLLRFAAPAFIAVLLLAAWQGLVVHYQVPAYIVPSPWLVLQTLVADRALLADALSVTLGIALTALGIATVAGT